MGGQAPLTVPFMDSSTMTKQVSIDTAPAYAAMLVAEDRDMRQLFTGKTDTCPTFDLVTGNITKRPTASSVAAPARRCPAITCRRGIRPVCSPTPASWRSTLELRVPSRPPGAGAVCVHALPGRAGQAPQQIGPYLYLFAVAGG